MPNGARIPYRMVAAVDEVLLSLSPIHTSDSEETYRHKRKYRRLARWVLSRWKDFTNRKILRRTLAVAAVEAFLSRHTDAWLFKEILSFLVPDRAQLWKTPRA